MKKIYEDMKIDLILLLEEVVRTSQSDNVEDTPDFPENFG